MKVQTIRRAMFALMAALGSAHAMAQADDAGQRQRIERERAVAEARFSAREAACQVRFAVTDCVEAARRERREALRHLRRQEFRLDDADRKRRAAERLQDIESRARRAAERPAGPIGGERPASAGATVAPAPMPAAGDPAPAARTPSPPRPAKPRKAKPVPDPVARQRQEADSRARFDARQTAIEARREAVELRNAQRAKEGKRSQPLPLPPPSAASAP